MSALTSLGIFHTGVSLVALGAGVAALWRDRVISTSTRLGQVYIWTTVVTCVTGFGIFEHGGFGKPHALGVLTLLLLGVAAGEGRAAYLGRSSRLVVAGLYSTTVFLHLVPGITETLTRLPAGQPVFDSADDPRLAALVAAVFVVAATLVALQLRALRRGERPDGTPALQARSR